MEISSICHNFWIYSYHLCGTLGKYTIVSPQLGSQACFNLSSSFALILTNFVFYSPTCTISSFESTVLIKLNFPIFVGYLTFNFYLACTS